MPTQRRPWIRFSCRWLGSSGHGLQALQGSPVRTAALGLSLWQWKHGSGRFERPCNHSGGEAVLGFSHTAFQRVVKEF